MRRLLISSLALALAVPLAAQAGPTPLTPLQLADQTAHRLGTTLAAGTGPISSPNVTLAATIPGTYISMRKVGTHLIATGTDGLTTFDISNPLLPRPLATLPIAHFENEDVSADNRVAVISNDRESGSKGGLLYVVDIANPAVPLLASTLSLDVNTGERGPGHIANCVAPGANPCTTLWLTGGKRVWVVDLRVPAKPVLLGAFDSPASSGSSGFGKPGVAGTGATHDVERDSTGTLWVTGSGGAFGYRLTSRPLKPQLLTGTGAQGIDPKVNDFILHNSQRVSPSTLAITEEDYLDSSYTPPGRCQGQGKFQTWDVRGTKPLRLLNQWQTEITGTPFLSGNKAPVTANCSSHWFTVSGNTAAVGWYEQGTRLLDVSNPRKIRQVGFWLPPNAVTWGAYWITPDIVYTADVGRGLDVLQVDRSATASVAAPIRASWLGVGTRTSLTTPTRTWKWVCGTVLDGMHPSKP